MSPAGVPTLVVLAAGQAKRYGGVKPLAPVGPSGEAVIDLLASDALAAGFGRFVLVIGPATGPALRYHVERVWPHRLDVRFAVQDVPRGTVDAVLTAAAHLEGDASFGVANADDVYGEEGLGLLAHHVAGDDPGNALVCYRLRNSLIGDAPVTRGICHVGAGGLLQGVEERRKVTPGSDGRILSHDGRTPAELDPEALVSVNLWGFRPGIRNRFEAAMQQAGDGEVLLPEVIGALVGDTSAEAAVRRFRVLEAQSRCIGVTHPGDLALVQADLAAQVSRGERAAVPWLDGDGSPVAIPAPVVVPSTQQVRAESH